MGAGENFSKVALQVENLVGVKGQFPGFELTFGANEIVFDFVPGFSVQPGIETIRRTAHLPMADPTRS